MSKENEGDVNLEEETLVTEVEEEGNDDELVTPALEEEPTTEDIEELKSGAESPAPEEGTEEEETEESDETETDEDPPVLIQPKPVEGETPRERALRKQIEVLRDKVRNKEELIKSTPAPISNEEYNELKNTYTDDEIKQLEVVFDVIGKKKGYVKQDELYAQSGNEFLDAFINSHPEYKAENDIDDIRWNTFKRILQADYNLNGKQPKELTKIFDKVHRDVAEEFGETPTRGLSPNRRNAEIQKIKSVSHSGGTRSGRPRQSYAPTDPKVRQMFKGFEDDDF